MTQENKDLTKNETDNSAVKELQGSFEREGLNLPSIAEKFYPELKKLSTFLYSTRGDDTPDPYNLSWYLNEIQNKKVDDYLIIGNTGHGANSWAMHVYFVDGPFACFLQKRWGGAFGDPEAARESFNKALIAIDHLRERLETAQKENKLKSNQRLVLVESDFSKNKWIWLEEGSKVVEENAWNTQEPTFLLAWASIP